MRKTVAVDLDGVLADFSAGWQGVATIGDPLPGAAEFTRRLAEFADVLIDTTRCAAGEVDHPGLAVARLRETVAAWLERHGFTYHDIWTGQGKPLYAALVDDRAVPCRPQETAAAFPAALAAARLLCGAADPAAAGRASP
jgi:hypothetical protein